MQMLDVDDEGDRADSEVLELDDEDLSAPPRRDPELLRSKHYKREHRQVATPARAKMGEPSPWEQPREGFTAAMAKRAPEMSKTKEGRSVRGITIATERF